MFNPRDLTVDSQKLQDDIQHCKLTVDSQYFTVIVDTLQLTVVISQLTYDSWQLTVESWQQSFFKLHPVWIYLTGRTFDGASQSVSFCVRILLVQMNYNFCLKWNMTLTLTPKEVSFPIYFKIIFVNIFWTAKDIGCMWILFKFNSFRIKN